MTTMTKQEQQLMKNPQTRLDMVREYLLTQTPEDACEYRSAISDAFRAQLKSKKGRNNWRKHCAKDYEAWCLANMTDEEREGYALQEAEFDERMRLANIERRPAFIKMMAGLVLTAFTIYGIIIYFLTQTSYY